MKSPIYFIILYFCIVSCSNHTVTDKKSSVKDDYNYILSVSDTLNIPIDNSIICWSRNNQVFYDPILEINYLVRANETSNVLEFFDLTKKTLSYKIKFDKEGPKGIGKLRGFYVHNIDSIFINGVNRKKIWLFNKNGNLLNIFNFKFNNLTEDIGDFYCYKKNPLLFYNNKINISIIPNKDHDLSPELFFSDPIGFTYNLKEEKVKICRIKYPELYNEDIYSSSGNIFFSRTYNPESEELVYSFPIDPFLYVIDKNGNIKKAKAQSDYFTKAEPMQNHNYDYQRRRRYYLETPKYHYIIYDPYRHVYYRFCLLAVNYNTKKTYHGFISLEMPATIMVLDTNFNKLVETKLPEKKLFYSKSFITEEGLWISNNSPLNPDFDENKLSFTLFTLEKIE